MSDVSVMDTDWREFEFNVPSDGDRFGIWFVKAVIERPPTAHLIHDRCWELLVKHFDDSSEIRLDRLFEVCRDVPWPNIEQRVAGREDFDPRKPPIIRGLRKAAQSRPKPNGACVGGNSSSGRPSMTDCFISLPVEIRMEIAAYLSTVDFLKVRCCSRAMAVIFTRQAFWKTRFLLTGDRGFLNYLLEDDRKNHDWRLIYCCTNNLDEYSSPHLWNRRRHWRRNQWLKDRLLMTRGESSSFSKQVNPMPNSGVCWENELVARGKFRCDRHCETGTSEDLCHICFSEHTRFSQTVPLSDALIGIAVSILHEEETTYITGFELIHAGREKPNIIFGHRLPSRQVMMDIQRQPLRGFVVVTGEGGIHAIRPVSDMDSTNWMGRPDGEGCRYVQLVPSQDIKALSGEFDVSV